MAINDVLKDMYKKNTGKELTEEAHNVEDTLKAINRDIPLGGGGGGGHDSKKNCEVLVDSIFGDRSHMPSGVGPAFDINFYGVFSSQIQSDPNLFNQNQVYWLMRMASDIFDNREPQTASELFSILEDAFLNQEYVATDGTVITDVFASETIDYESMEKDLTRAYGFLEAKRNRYLSDDILKYGYEITLLESLLSMFTQKESYTDNDVCNVYFLLLPDDMAVSEIGWAPSVSEAWGEFVSNMDLAGDFHSVPAEATVAFYLYLSAVFAYINDLGEGAERTVLYEYKSIKFLRALVCMTYGIDPINHYSDIDFASASVDPSILWFIYKITQTTNLDNIYMQALPSPLYEDIMFGNGRVFIGKMCRISTYVKGLS